MDDEVALELLRSFRASGSRRVRNEVVEGHIGLAIHIARKFSSGRSDDDLRQVALLGLVKAVDRFDPERGVPFGAFAVSTVEGEVKRYFRDQTWSVRVPRSAKELNIAVRRAVDQLGHELGRSPTVDEIARHLDVSRDDVITGLDAGNARTPASIDAPFAADDGSAPSMRLGDDRDDVGLADQRAEVDWLLERLPEREREIVILRFFEEMSQNDIAVQVGMSQMHVSRLLRRSCERMRSWADDADSADDAESMV